jgi:hypothetical protein
MPNEDKIKRWTDELSQGITDFPGGIETPEDADNALKRLKLMDKVVDDLKDDFETEKEKLEEKYSPLIYAQKEQVELMALLTTFAVKDAENWDGDKLSLTEGVLKMDEGGDSLLVNKKSTISDKEVADVVADLKEKFPTDYLEYVSVKFALKKNEIKQAIKSKLFDEKFCKKVGLSIEPTKKFKVKLFSDVKE